jgi:hypothetical protein
VQLVGPDITINEGLRALLFCDRLCHATNLAVIGRIR